MEVSHFELIFKPQSPASPPGVNVDRVIQGYFLEITNLEAVEYRYQLEFIAVPPAPGVVDRSLAGNTIVFVDVPGSDDQGAILSGSFVTSTFLLSTGLIRIPSLATALVAVLPSAFGPTPLDPSPLTTPDFEVRGFVRIKLPAVRPSIIGPSFIRVPQSKTPVKVLLTPQNRATFIAANGAINGQTQASLPLASGAALNSIQPEPGGPMKIGPLQNAAFSEISEALEKNPELATPEMLAMLLGSVDATADLNALNAALAQAGIKVALVKQKGKDDAR